MTVGVGTLRPGYARARLGTLLEHGMLLSQACGVGRVGAGSYAERWGRAYHTRGTSPIDFVPLRTAVKSHTVAEQLPETARHSLTTKVVGAHGSVPANHWVRSATPCSNEKARAMARRFTLSPAEQDARKPGVGTRPSRYAGECAGTRPSRNAGERVGTRPSRNAEECAGTRPSRNAEECAGTRPSRNAEGCAGTRPSRYAEALKESAGTRPSRNADDSRGDPSVTER